MVENIKWYGGMNILQTPLGMVLECIRAALLMVDDSTKRQSGNQRCLGQVEQQKWVTSRQNVEQFSLLSSGVGQIPALCFSRQNAGTWILILHSPHRFRMERTDLDSSQKFNFVFPIPHCPIVSPYVPVKATRIDRPSDVHIRWPHGDEETPAFVELHHSAYAMGTLRRCGAVPNLGIAGI